MTAEGPGPAQGAAEVLSRLAPGTPLRRLLARIAHDAGPLPVWAGPGAPAPFLSVLVRTQGRRPATLQETLLSLAAQSSEDFEVLLLAHDAPPEAVADLEGLVGEFHPSFARRVKVLAVHGGGRSRPLNVGAAAAAGRYLAVLDDDDLAFTDWVAAFLAAAERAPGHVVRCAVAVQQVVGTGGDGGGYEVESRPNVDYPLRFDMLDHLDDNRTPVNGYALPRPVVTELGQGWDESLAVLEDWDQLLRVAPLCGVEDTGAVGAMLRSWLADEASSKTDHDTTVWDAAHARVVAGRDGEPLVMDRGSITRLVRLKRTELAARLANQLANQEVVALARQLRLAQEAVARSNQEASATHARLAETSARLEEVLASTTWRAMEGPRRLSGALRRATGALRGRPAPGVAASDAPPPHPVPHTDPESYRRWVTRFDTLDRAREAAVRRRVAALATAPRISVVMPVYDPRPSYLRAAVASVQAQVYGNWELCIADDCSADPEVGAVLERTARRDRRVKVVRRTENGHISAASNSALALATGDWVAFLDHDDVLAPHALAVMALHISARPDAGLLYSDEDKLDGEGRRHSPYFKPEFDLRLLVGQNYLTHLLVVRRDLVQRLGGLREGIEGAQDWDLVLRAAEELGDERIVHVPHVLYHWRAHSASTAEAGSAKPYAWEAGRRAVAEHLARAGGVGEATVLERSGHVRVRWPLPHPAPSVGIVIPTRDGRLLRQCIESILSTTRYPHYRVLVVDNGSRDPTVLDYLDMRKGPSVRVRRDPGPFNYSALNNAAVDTCDEDLVCLLNDDTQIVEPGWLEEMVREVSRPQVGAVGAKLLYEDGTIQHAGVVLGIGDVAGHAYRRFPRDADGDMGRLRLAQTMSAVTGACMLVRRQAWDDVGGLDEEELAVAFNDVDFCLRLGEAGWRVVWTPYAELFHLESVSRGTELLREKEFAGEIACMQRRWSGRLRADPAYNPNLTLVYEDWSLAWPPRVSIDDVATGPGGRLSD
jgi:glycosyltransferase involved in cell wall biosynthesis